VRARSLYRESRLIRIPMPFQLENRKDGPDGISANLDWLYTQDYEDGENHVTESVFKWFFFSSARLQVQFLVEMCGLPKRDSRWTSFNLQKKGKTGTPDATLHLENGQQILFEVKIKPKTVSRHQLIRHLKDAGLKKPSNSAGARPVLILVTPDFEEPKKLGELPMEYRKAIRWVPWTKLVHFFSTRIRYDLHSSVDRSLRAGLTILLKRDYLKKYLP
jgi:hypothetical protein